MRTSPPPLYVNQTHEDWSLPAYSVFRAGRDPARHLFFDAGGIGNPCAAPPGAQWVNGNPGRRLLTVSASLHAIYDVKSPVRFYMRRFHSRALITKKIQFKSQVSRSSSSQMAPWRNLALYLRGWPFTRVLARRKQKRWGSFLTRGVF